MQTKPGLHGAPPSAVEQHVPSSAPQGAAESGFAVASATSRLPSRFSRGSSPSQL